MIYVLSKIVRYAIILVELYFLRVRYISWSSLKGEHSDHKYLCVCHN